MLQNRKPVVWVILSVLACGSIIVADAASGSSSRMMLGSGQSLSVGCSAGSIRFAPSSGSSGVVTCSSATSASTSTTSSTSTTVAPPTTTSTTIAPTTTTTTAPSGGATGCRQFMTEPTATMAFCDPMNTNEHVAGTRSGSLNGVLWGVSRMGSDINTGQGLLNDWAASTQDQCGTNVQVAPGSDVNSCNGETVESVNDAGGQTVLQMYPRQPFNFAGRTGVVEFNMSNNSLSSHAAWTSFSITDQPFAAADPEDLPGMIDNARNSVVVYFEGCGLGGGQNCGSNTPANHPATCVIPVIEQTVNYVTESVPYSTDGCVDLSSSPTALDHVEVQVSPTSMVVYMSDPGNPSSLRKVGHADFTLPLTQGLVWLGDEHYNGDKYCDASPPQCEQTDTFGWSDLAFDGPVLPRDLGFDVLDNTAPGGTAPSGQPMTSLGYKVPAGGSLTVSTANPVTAADISAATGALLEMTYMAPKTVITYDVNGHSNTFNTSTAMANSSYPTFTLSLPVPLSELVAGVNTIQVSSADGLTDTAGNFDLILQGAGGVVPPS